MANRTCIIIEHGVLCGKPVVGRDMCRKHYTRWGRHGDALYGADRVAPGTGGVYSITCLTNGWVYVGSSMSVRSRWSTHQSWLRNGTHNVPQMQADWAAHGAESFVFDLISIAENKDERLAREQEHLDVAIATGKCYNLSPSVAGKYLLNAGQRQKLSDAMTGKPKSAEHRANLWQDREVTADFRDQMAANGRRLKGVGKSDETRLRMSAAQEDRVLLTEPQVQEIKRLLAEGTMTGAAIGRQFGVERGAISAIRNGRTWPHVGIPAQREPQQESLIT